MLKNFKGARQGDLSFHPIDKLPANLKKIEHNGSFVLAKGEFTGHSHRVLVADPQQINIYQDRYGRYVLEIKDKTEIVHEEHKTIILQPGIYIQEIEQERDPFLDAIRQVKD